MGKTDRIEEREREWGGKDTCCAVVAPPSRLLKTIPLALFSSARSEWDHVIGMDDAPIWAINKRTTNALKKIHLTSTLRIG